MNTVRSEQKSAAARLEEIGFSSSVVRAMYIDGEWRDGAGEPMDCVSPIDGSLVARIGTAVSSDVALAAEAGAAAFRRGDWSRMPAHERAKVLQRVADRIESDCSRLAVIQTVDNGKPLHESVEQVHGAAQTFRYYSSLCETLESSVVPSRGDYFSFTTYEPIGVVAAITPWNSPLTLEALKLAPALAVGNSVIVKPSEVTPLISLEYARILHELGFPRGVVNVIQGSGAYAGGPLVEDPRIDMVSFTGGVSTGRSIARTAGERLIPAVVELGGKSPNIIFADADLDAAVDGAAFAIFSNSGQSCIAGSRIFVQQEVYEEFICRLADRTRSLKVGDPFDPNTRVGPLASFRHRDYVNGCIDLGLAEGARVLAGGETLSGGEFEAGAFVSPTLLEIDSNKRAIARREIFGPVGVLLRFRDEADLIAQANDTEFGLACGIWTTDYRKALRVGRALRAGIQWINTYKVAPPNMPFGGFKNSGIWREGGRDGLRYYQEMKSVYLDTAQQPFFWP